MTDSGRELQASDFDFATSFEFRRWTAVVYDDESLPPIHEPAPLPPIECGERAFELHWSPEIQQPETPADKQLQALRSRVHALEGRTALATARKQEATGALRRPRPEPLGATNLSVQIEA